MGFVGKAQKWTLTATGAVFAMGSITFLLFMLSGFVVPVGEAYQFSIFGVWNGMSVGSATETQSPLFFLVLGVFFATMVDAGIVLVRRGLAMRSAGKPVLNQGVFWRISGSFGAITQAIGLVGMFALFAFAMFAAASLLVSALTLNEPNIGIEFKMLILGVVVYPIFGRLFRFVGKKLTNSTAHYFAEYSVKENGVDITMLYRRVGEEKRRTFFVGFNELNEISPMSLGEVQAMVDDFVKGDPKILIKEMRGLYRFFKHGDRPDVIVRQGVSGTTGTPVLLQGAEIKYLFAFDVPNVDDLAESFTKHKSSR